MIFLFQGCFLRFHVNLPGWIQPKKQLWTCYITIWTAFQNLERLAFPIMRSWRGDPLPLRTKLLLRRQAATPCNRWPGNLFCQTNTCPKNKRNVLIAIVPGKNRSKKRGWDVLVFSFGWMFLSLLKGFLKAVPGEIRHHPLAENGRCPILRSCFCCKNWTSILMFFPGSKLNNSERKLSESIFKVHRNERSSYEYFFGGFQQKKTCCSSGLGWKNASVPAKQIPGDSSRDLFLQQPLKGSQITIPKRSPAELPRNPHNIPVFLESYIPISICDFRFLDHQSH